MDEIKNTAAAEELQNAAKTVAAEETNVEQAPVETEETPAAPEAAPADEPANPETTAPADEPQTPTPTTKAEVIARLKEIVYNGGDAQRTELEHLKSLYYRLHNAEAAAAREEFIANGGEPDAFIPAPDTTEEEFKAQYALVRELRAKAAEAAEAEKKANLERKQQIIERIKALAETPDTADKGYNEVKELQAEWKEIKAVPAEHATELWKNYQLYTEQFYDQLRLNHEMRAYDFKKNLEIKTHLCEAAEKLAEVEDPISAFHQLQKLHQEYRETGPVAKEQREEIWKRFKDASTVINKRHQDHFEALKAEEEENLRRKTELCLKVEALNLDELHAYNDWEAMTQQVLALQAEWKTIGFTPRKVNTEIFERFRVGCDRFFRAKTAYFKENRERLNANLAAKTALAEKAEALKDSTDWGATTNALVALQKEWKEIGPVPRKVSDAIWKRFNDACNAFFKAKNEQGASQRKEEEANLEQKKGVIAELEALAEAMGDGALEAVRALQARWAEIGHVPFSKKEKVYRQYRALCDKIYDALHESRGRQRLDSFRSRVAEKGGSELSRELQKLQNVFEAKKKEIQTYETNITFFAAASKKANPLLADIEKKIARLKEDLEEIKQKIAAVKEQSSKE